MENTNPIPREGSCIYAAGVYESEGSCGAYLHGIGKYTLRRPQIAVRIEMYDIDIIKFLHTEFGGNYTPRKRAAQVSWKGEQAITFLKAILPHIKGRRRREQAAIVFKLHEAKKQKLGRKDEHRRLILLDLSYRINGFNYGGGKKTRRDYTLITDDIVQATDAIINSVDET